MRKNDPARPYIRAMFEKNRLRFFLVSLLGIVLQFPMLFVSWALGEVVDVIGAGEMAGLWRVLWPTAIFIATFLALELTYSSISAFSRENTGRYLAVLTSDVEKIQTDYLETILWLIPQPVGIVGTLWMMLRRSPLLTLITVGLSLMSIASTLLLSPGLTKRGLCGDCEGSPDRFFRH